MKKLFSLLFVALLSMTAWAGTSTLTFEAACGGTGTADDGAVWTVTSDAAESVYDATKGIHYGTSKVAVSYLTLTTSDIPGTITSIKVNASGAANQTPVLDVTVGGNTFGTQQTLSGDAAEYTLTGEASGEIVVTISQASAKKALYCKSIEVTYETGGTPEPAVAAPVFNPNGGEITQSTEVTLTCATENASIYYWEGTEEDQGQWIYYNAPFYVNETKTYTAIATKGSDYSDYVTVTFTKVVPTCATPTFNPASGTTFTEGEMLTVVISSETEGATITYTVNDDIFEGTTPVSVPIDMTATITAVASKSGYLDSEEATATYTMLPAFEGYTFEFFPTTDTIPGFETPGATQGKLTVTKDRVTFVISNGRYSNYTQGTTEYHEYRIFKNATINFSTTYGKIVKIEFIGSDVSPDNSPRSAFGDSQGLTYSADGMIGTWTGNATNVSFTASGIQCRASEIIVYVEGDEPNIAVAEPVFNPGTTGFTGSQVVKLTCETEGAAIYYSINDAEYQLYTAPFTVTQDSTVVKAYAELQGVQSTIATAKYYKRAEVTSLAEANGLQHRKDFVFYGNVVVVYQHGQYLYVKDDTDCGLIYGTAPEFAVGTTLDEEWTAQYQLYRDYIDEYMYPADLAATDAELVEIVPTEYTSDQITTDVINERVIVKDLTLIAETNTAVANYEKYLYNAADSLVIFNQFGITYPELEEGKTYDVEGMVSYYKGKVQIMPIAITEHETAVEVLLGDVNGDGVINPTDATVLINALLNENFDSIVFANSDMDGNGTINVTDAIQLINMLLTL